MFGLRRLRLLPALIVVAVLMLSVRIVAVWDDLDPGQSTISLRGSAALAQQTPANGANGTLQPPSPTSSSNAEPPPPGAAPATPSPVQTDLESASAPPGNSDVAAGLQHAALEAPGHRENGVFTPSEVSLLQRLHERREQLEQIERDQDRREAMLKAAERQIDTKIGELKRLETSIQALMRQQDDEERARLDKLATLYQTMKPAEAANVLNGMETALIVDILLIMKERSAAPILANMDAPRAREVTQALAHRRIEASVAAQPQG